jgi:hypothetical protein
MPGCLSPKKMRKSTRVKHGMYSFNDDTVKVFCYTIFALCIMDGQFLLGAGRLQVPDEFLAEVLATSIRVKGFDGGTSLGTKMSLELLVCIKGTIFLMKKVGMAVAVRATLTVLMNHFSLKI